MNGKKPLTLPSGAQIQGHVPDSAYKNIAMKSDGMIPTPNQQQGSPTKTLKLPEGALVNDQSSIDFADSNHPIFHQEPNEINDPGIFSQALNNFNLSKDSVELSMWEGLSKLSDGKVPAEGIGGKFDLALAKTLGPEFIQSRIDANEIDIAFEKSKLINSPKDGEFNFTDIWKDPEHFFGTQLPSTIGGAMGLMLEPLIAGTAVGALGGMAATGVGAPAAAGITSLLIGGATTLAMSRPLESVAEANESYEIAKEIYLKEHPDATEEELNDVASRSYSHTFNKNMVLGIQDAGQMALAIIPVGRFVKPFAKIGATSLASRIATRTALLSAQHPVKEFILREMGSGAWEGFEEIYQHKISKESEALAGGGLPEDVTWQEILEDDDSWNQFRAGMMGGIAMGSVQAAIARGASAFEDASNKINNGDFEGFEKNQKEVLSNLISKAAYTNGDVKLLSGLETMARTGMFNQDATNTDRVDARKSSMQYLRKTLLPKIEKELKEVRAIKKRFPKIASAANLARFSTINEKLVDINSEITKLNDTDKPTPNAEGVVEEKIFDPTDAAYKEELEKQKEELFVEKAEIVLGIDVVGRERAKNKLNEDAEKVDVVDELDTAENPETTFDDTRVKKDLGDLETSEDIEVEEALTEEEYKNEEEFEPSEGEEEEEFEPATDEPDTKKKGVKFVTDKEGKTIVEDDKKVSDGTDKLTRTRRNIRLKARRNKNELSRRASSADLKKHQDILEETGMPDANEIPENILTEEHENKYAEIDSVLSDFVNERYNAPGNTLFKSFINTYLSIAKKDQLADSSFSQKLAIDNLIKAGMINNDALSGDITDINRGAANTLIHDATVKLEWLSQNADSPALSATYKKALNSLMNIMMRSKQLDEVSREEELYKKVDAVTTKRGANSTIKEIHELMDRYRDLMKRTDNPKSKKTKKDQIGDLQEAIYQLEEEFEIAVPVAESKESKEEESTDTSTRKTEGENKNGSIYKSTTKEKDGLIITKYEGYRKKDGKQYTLDGRRLTKEEFLSEYEVDDEDTLELLEGVEEIVIREVRNDKGKLGISVRLKLSDSSGSMNDFFWVNAEIAALESKEKEVQSDIKPDEGEEGGTESKSIALSYYAALKIKAKDKLGPWFIAGLTAALGYASKDLIDLSPSDIMSAVLIGGIQINEIMRDALREIAHKFFGVHGITNEEVRIKKSVKEAMKAGFDGVLAEKELEKLFTQISGPMQVFHAKIAEHIALQKKHDSMPKESRGPVQRNLDFLAKDIFNFEKILYDKIIVDALNDINRIYESESFQGAYAASERFTRLSNAVRAIYDPVVRDGDGNKIGENLKDDDGMEMSFRTVWGMLYDNHRSQRGVKPDFNNVLAFYKPIEEYSKELYDRLATHPNSMLMSMYTNFDNTIIQPSKLIMTRGDDFSWSSITENMFFGFSDSRAKLRRRMNLQLENTELWESFDDTREKGKIILGEYSKVEQSRKLLMGNLKAAKNKKNDIKSEKYATEYLDQTINFLSRYTGIPEDTWWQWSVIMLQARIDKSAKTKDDLISRLANNPDMEIAIDNLYMNVIQRKEATPSNDLLFDVTNWNEMTDSYKGNKFLDLFIGTTTFAPYKNFRKIFNDNNVDTNKGTLSKSKIKGNEGYLNYTGYNSAKSDAATLIKPIGKIGETLPKIDRFELIVDEDPRISSILSSIEKVTTTKGEERTALKISDSKKPYAGLIVAIDTEGNTVGYIEQFDPSLNNKSKGAEVQFTIANSHSEVLQSLMKNGFIGNSKEGKKVRKPMERSLAKGEYEALGIRIFGLAVTGITSKDYATSHKGGNGNRDNDSHLNSSMTIDLEDLVSGNQAEGRLTMISKYGEQGTNDWGDWYSGNGSGGFTRISGNKNHFELFVNPGTMSTIDKDLQRFILFSEGAENALPAKEAIATAKRLRDGLKAGGRIVFYDLETTGLNTENDEIVQMHATVVKSGKIFDQKTWLVKGDKTSNKEALAKHKISKAKREKGVPLAQAIKEFNDILRLEENPETIVSGHNIIRFDNKLLLNQASKVMPEFKLPQSADTFAIAQYMGQSTGNSLGELAKKYGVEVTNKKLHDAKEDVRVTVDVAKKMKDQVDFKNLIAGKVRTKHYLQFVGQQADDPGRLFTEAKIYGIEEAKDRLEKLRKQYNAKKENDIIPSDKRIKEIVKESLHHFKKINIGHIPNYSNLSLSDKEIALTHYWNNSILNEFMIQEYLQPMFYNYGENKIGNNYNPKDDLSIGEILRLIIKRKISGNGMNASLYKGRKPRQAVYNDILFDGKLGNRYINGTDVNGAPQIGSDGVIFISETMAKEMNLTYGSVYNFDHTFKFVYSGHQGRARTYNKANWVVVTKKASDYFSNHFGEDNPMTKVYNAMQRSDLDVLSFDSSVKIKPNNIELQDLDSNDIVDESNIIEMDTKYLFYQQNLQAGRGKESPFEKDASVQIGQHLTRFPEEKARIDSLWNDIAIKQDLKTRANFLNFTDTDFIKDAIIARLPNTPNGQSIKTVLENNKTSVFDMPEMAIGVILSLMESDVAKLKITGGILVEAPNMAGAGKLGDLSDISSQEKIDELIEKGKKLGTTDVLIPNKWRKKFKVDDNGEPLPGQLMLITRVPASDSHSTSLVQVKGFLPDDDSLGSVIMTHEGIAQIAGADYDGDQRQVWMKSEVDEDWTKLSDEEKDIKVTIAAEEINTLSRRIWNTQKELNSVSADHFKLAEKLAKIKGLSPEIMTSITRHFPGLVKDIFIGYKEEGITAKLINKKVTNFSKGIIEDAYVKIAPITKEEKNSLSKAMSDVSEMLHEIFDPESKEGISQLKKYNKMADSMKDDIEKRIEYEGDFQNYVMEKSNDIFDIIVEIYQNPANANKLLAAIDTKVSDSALRNVHGKDYKSKKGSQFALMDPRARERVEQETIDGEFLISVNARSNGGYAVERSHKSKIRAFGDNVKFPSLKRNNKLSKDGSPVVIASEEGANLVKHFTHNDVIKVDDNGKPNAKGLTRQERVDRIIFNAINHALDSVKDGKLSDLGYNRWSGSLLNTLYHAGFSEEQGAFLMLHPIAKMLAEAKKEMESPLFETTGHDEFDVVLQKIKGDLEGSKYALSSPSTYHDNISKNSTNKEVWMIKPDQLNKSYPAINKDGEYIFIGAEKKLNAIKLLDMFKYIGAVSREKHAIAMLSNLKDKPPKTLADFQKAKGYLKTLGISHNNASAEDTKNTLIEFSEKALEGNVEVDYVISFNKWWHSDEMKRARINMNLVDDFYQTYTVEGSDIAISVLSDVVDQVNLAKDPKGNYSSGVFFGNSRRSVQKAFGIIKDALYGTAMNVNPNHQELIKGLELLDENGAFESLKGNPNKGEEPLLIFDFKDFDSNEFTPRAKNIPIQLNKGQSLVGMDPSDLGILQEKFNQIPDEITINNKSYSPRIELVKYHISVFGFDPLTGVQGGFSELFDNKTRSIVDKRLINLMTYLDIHLSSERISNDPTSDQYRAQEIKNLLYKRLFEKMPDIVPQSEQDKNNLTRIDLNGIESVIVTDSWSKEGSRYNMEQIPLVLFKDKKGLKIAKVTNSGQVDWDNAELKSKYVGPTNGSLLNIFEEDSTAKKLDNIQYDKKEYFVRQKRKGTAANSGEKRSLLNFQKEAEGELASSNPELDAYITDELAKNFPDVKVFTNTEEYQKFLKAMDRFIPNIDEFSPEFLGAALYDTVYINPDKAVQRTSLHEHAHIYWAILPDGYIKNNLKKMFGGEENAVDAIAKAGVNILKMRKEGKSPTKFILLLKKFWAAIKTMLRIDAKSEFAEIAAHGMLDGQKKRAIILGDEIKLSGDVAENVRITEKWMFENILPSLIDVPNEPNRFKIKTKNGDQIAILEGITNILKKWRSGNEEDILDIAKDEDRIFVKQTEIGTAIHHILTYIAKGEMEIVNGETKRSEYLDAEKKPVQSIEDLYESVAVLIEEKDGVDIRKVMSVETFVKLHKIIDASVTELFEGKPKENFKIFSEVKIASIKSGLAAKIDLVIMDKETGHITFADLKTTSSTTNSFINNKDKSGYSKYDYAAGQLRLQEKMVRETDPDQKTQLNSSTDNGKPSMDVNRLVVLPLPMTVDLNSKGEVKKITITDDNLKIKALDVSTGKNGVKNKGNQIAQNAWDVGVSKAQQRTFTNPETNRFLTLQEFLKEMGQDQNFIAQSKNLANIEEEMLTANDVKKLNLKIKAEKIRTLLNNWRTEHNRYLVDYKELMKRYFNEKSLKNLQDNLLNVEAHGGGEGGKANVDYEFQQILNFIATKQAMAASQGINLIWQIYSAEQAEIVKRSGNKLWGKDINQADVWFRVPSNAPAEFHLMREAMRAKLAANGMINHEYANYEKKRQKLIAALIKENKNIDAGPKARFLQSLTPFNKDRGIDFSVLFTNMLEPTETDGIEHERLKDYADMSNNLTPNERAWIEFAWDKLEEAAVWDNPIIAERAKVDENVVDTEAQNRKKNFHTRKETGDYTKQAMTLKEALKLATESKFVNVAKALLISHRANLAQFYYKDPNNPNGIWLYSDYEDAVELYDAYLQNGGYQEKQVDQAIKDFKRISDKANRLAEAGQIEEKSMPVNYKGVEKPNKTSGNYGKADPGYTIVGGQLVKSKQQIAPRFRLTEQTGLETRFDKPRKPGMLYSKDLDAAFSTEIKERIHIKHMSPILPKWISAFIVYGILEKRGETIGNANEWLMHHFEKDILVKQTEKRVDPTVRTIANGLRYLTFIKVMALNVPLSVVNFLQGASAVMIYQGFNNIGKRFMTNPEVNNGYMVGLKRFMKDPKKFVGVIKGLKISNYSPENLDVAVPIKSNLENLQNMALIMIEYGELFNQGISFVAYLTDEQYANLNELGEVKGLDSEGNVTPGSPLARKQALEEDGQMGSDEYEQNFLTPDDVAKYKSWKDAVLGYYDKNNKGAYSRYLFAQMGMMFKGWLPAVWKLHVGEHQRDVYDKDMKGILRSTHEEMLRLINFMWRFSDKKVFHQLPKREQIDIENHWKLFKEMVLIGLIWAVANFDDDDDDDMLTRTSYYLLQQVAFFYDLDSWEQTIGGTVAPPVSYAFQTANALKDLLTLEQYKRSGRGYKRGQYKFLRTIPKQIPIVNRIIDTGGIKAIMENNNLK